MILLSHLIPYHTSSHSPRKCIRREQRDTWPSFRKRWHESFSHAYWTTSYARSGLYFQRGTWLVSSPEGQRSTAQRYLSQVAATDSHQDPDMLPLVGFQHEEKRLGSILFFRVLGNMRAVLEGRLLRRAPWNPNAPVHMD